MRSIDDYDYDAGRKEERFHIGFIVSFKSMTLLLNRMEDEIGEFDDQYPRKELLKIWSSIMVVMFVLFLLSYNILFVATLPFIFFYGLALKQLFHAWKRFKYQMGFLRIITLATLVVEIAAAFGLQVLILG